MADFEILDQKRLEAIRSQAEYRKSLSFGERFDIAMNHLESLRNLKRTARRVPSETIR